MVAVIVVRETGTALAAVIDELVEVRSILPELELLVIDHSSDGGAGRLAAEWAAITHTPCETLTGRTDHDDARPEPWDVVWTGIERAAAWPTTELIVSIDPDGHHDARSIPELIEAARRSGAGVTIGSRWVSGGSAPGTGLPRRLLSKLAARLIGSWSGVPRVHDIMSSFRVLRPEVVHLVGGERVARGVYGSYAEFVAVSRALGFAIGEIPIEFRPRHSPVPPLSVRDLLTFAGDLVRIRRRVRNVRTRMRADQTDWSTRSPGSHHQDPALDDDFGAIAELTTLSQAANFTEWIVEQFEDALGDRVLEVGAGLGAVSRCIVERHPRTHVTALEPAPNVTPELRRAVDGVDRITVSAVTSQEWFEEDTDRTYDTVVYINVLEHIRDDLAELRTARGLLRPNGRLCIFVPASPRLYGSLDHRSGHYRRYTEQRLAKAVHEAGFEIERIHHLDALGVVPYWFLYRVFRVGRLGATTSRLYDRALVPIGRRLERTFGHPPFGKNLVLVAHRNSGSPGDHDLVAP